MILVKMKETAEQFLGHPVKQAAGGPDLTGHSLHHRSYHRSYPRSWPMLKCSVHSVSVGIDFAD